MQPIDSISFLPGRTLNDERLLTALCVLQQCYEQALRDGDEQLAAASRQECPGWVKLLRRRAPSFSDDHKKSALVVFNYFDDCGYPHRSRADCEESLFIKMSALGGAWQAGNLNLSVVKQAIPKELWAPPQRTTASKLAGPKIGRNDQCPCGSGKKYKVCCGR